MLKPYLFLATILVSALFSLVSKSAFAVGPYDFVIGNASWETTFGVMSPEEIKVSKAQAAVLMEKSCKRVMKKPVPVANSKNGNAFILASLCFLDSKGVEPRYTIVKSDFYAKSPESYGVKDLELREYRANYSKAVQELVISCRTAGGILGLKLILKDGIPLQEEINMSSAFMTNDEEYKRVVIAACFLRK